VEVLLTKKAKHNFNPQQLNKKKAKTIRGLIKQILTISSILQVKTSLNRFQIPYLENLIVATSKLRKVKR
jgi:hypothetical protein